MFSVQSNRMSQFDLRIAPESFTSAGVHSEYSSGASSSSSDSENKKFVNPEKRRKIFRSPERQDKTTVEVESTTSDSKRHLILEYSIDPYEYSDEFLIEMSIEMFNYYKLPELFKFNNDTLVAFISSVRNLYHPANNFHNFKHAWGVMHMSFQLLVHGVDKCLTSLDIFAVLIAAVCHDVGHKGNNNAFELATKSDVSMEYQMPNESCVLERYHCGLTRKLLFPESDDRNNWILKGLKDDDERERFLAHVHFIILGTDMAKHASLVEETQQLVEMAKQLSEKSSDSTSDEENDQGSGESKKTTDASCDTSEVSETINPGRSDRRMTPRPGQKHEKQNYPSSPTGITSAGRESNRAERLFIDEKSRQKLTRILVHTADIGAQTQEYSIAYKWVNRCYTEFQTQAQKEKQLGIITSPFLHELTDDKKIFASQYSFITDIVEPIWSAFTALFPDLQFASGQLLTNKTSYKQYF